MLQLKRPSKVTERSKKMSCKRLNSITKQGLGLWILGNVQLSATTFLEHVSRERGSCAKLLRAPDLDVTSPAWSQVPNAKYQIDNLVCFYGS